MRDLFVGSLGRSGRLIRARQEAARRGVLVLTLHRIVPDAQRPLVRSPAGMVLRESLFEALVEYLARNTTCIAASELGRVRASSSKPNVLVTFDDGWVDNAQVAWPVLKRAGIPMCIFVTTGVAGTKQPFWPERLIGILRAAACGGRSDLLRERLSRLARAHGRPGKGSSNWSRLAYAKRDPESVITWLKGTPEEAILEVIEEWSHNLAGQNESPAANLASGQPSLLRDPNERILSWQDMQQLQVAGVCFGSHTVSHPILTARSVREVACELSDSRSAIRDRLGDTVLLAYPNGDANELVTQEARRAGYRYGFSNTTGIWNSSTDPLLVPRVNLWDGKLIDGEGRFSIDHLEYSIFWKALRAE